MNPLRSRAYHSYLLRVRRIQDQGRSAATWRFSLESPDGQERHIFATLDALTAFLAFLTDEERWDR